MQLVPWLYPLTPCEVTSGVFGKNGLFHGVKFILLPLHLPMHPLQWTTPSLPPSWSPCLPGPSMLVPPCVLYQNGCSLYPPCNHNAQKTCLVLSKPFNSDEEVGPYLLTFAQLGWFSFPWLFPVHTAAASHCHCCWVLLQLHRAEQVLLAGPVSHSGLGRCRLELSGAFLAFSLWCSYHTVQPPYSATSRLRKG